MKHNRLASFLRYSITLLIFVFPLVLEAQNDLCAPETIVSTFAAAVEAGTVSEWAQSYLVSECSQSVKDAVHTFETTYTSISTDVASSPLDAGSQLVPLPNSQLTDEEKFASWEGERVVFLGYRPDDSTEYVNQFLPVGFRPYGYFVFGSPDQNLPVHEYAGRSGVITEFLQSGNPNLTDLVITLDDNGEQVVGLGTYPLGFIAEMEVAQSYVGYFLWIKQRMSWVRNCSIELTEDQLESVTVGIGQRLRIIRAEWGAPGRPIFLYLQTDDGDEVCLNPIMTSKNFDNRFHQTQEKGV